MLLRLIVSSPLLMNVVGSSDVVQTTPCAGWHDADSLSGSVSPLAVLHGSTHAWVIVGVIGAIVLYPTYDQLSVVWVYDLVMSRVRGLYVSD